MLLDFNDIKDPILQRVAKDDMSLFDDRPSGWCDTKEYIRWGNHTPLSIACAFASINILKRFFSKNRNGSYKFLDVVSKIAAENNLALCVAAGNGHLHVVNRLLAKKPSGRCEFPSIVSHIATGLDDALACAAQGGHLDVINRLLAKKPSGRYEFPAIVSHIAENDNFVLSVAAKFGHLHVINRLLAKNPNGKYEFPSVVTHIAVRDNEILRNALQAGQPYVIERLLDFEEVFSYAELHSGIYEEYVVHFINKYLEKISTSRNALSSISRQQMYQLSRDEALFAIIVVRSLIRRNRPLSEINMLLNIPQVAILVDRDENELLQLALRLNNTAACQRLLQFPAVLQLAQANQFYTQEINNGPDLRAMAQHAESSMVALSGPEKERVDNLKKRYQGVLEKAGGTNSVINHFKQYLIHQYQQKPATLHINRTSSILPLGWEDLQTMRETQHWSDATYQKALEAYYQHPFHTAYRFLSTPNRWIAQNASYVVVDDNNRSERHADFEHYLPLIAYYWLAASDEKEPACDGCGHVERMELFAKQLAFVNRQHNWDKKKLNRKTRKMGEFDDLEGDKPSCSPGMARNFFQSIHSHSVMMLQAYVPVAALDYEVNRCAHDFYKKYFDGLEPHKKQELKTSVDNYFIELDEAKKPNIPNLSNIIICNLKKSLNKQYKNMQVDKYESIDDFVNKSLNADDFEGSHFLKYYDTLKLCEMMEPQKIKHVRRV